MKFSQYIHHRINSLKELQNIPMEHGVEVDVRYHNDMLILQHDPFKHHITPNTSLNEFAACYKHTGPLILNLKTEGIEEACIKIMQENNIKNWFFLDMSMAYFVKYAQHASSGKIEGFSPRNLAVRFSEKEPIEYALAFCGQAEWLWVDCFTTLPINAVNFEVISKNFKVCLVSPELQGHPLERIQEFKQILSNSKIDAVCSKRIDLWQK